MSALCAIPKARSRLKYTSRHALRSPLCPLRASMSDPYQPIRNMTSLLRGAEAGGYFHLQPYRKMSSPKKIFGTEGVRGTANVEPVTAETALKLGRAAAHVFKNLHAESRRRRRHPTVL